MKHTHVYYTCDRCGTKIPDPLIDLKEGEGSGTVQYKLNWNMAPGSNHKFSVNRGHTRYEKELCLSCVIKLKKWLEGRK